MSALCCHSVKGVLLVGFMLFLGQANLVYNLCLGPQPISSSNAFGFEVLQGVTLSQGTHFRTALLGLAGITLLASPAALGAFILLNCWVWLVQPCPVAVSQPHLAAFTRSPKWPTLPTSFTPVSGIISPHPPASSVLSWAAIPIFSGMLCYCRALSVWIS